MSKHYLTCSNENCGRTECVGRREFEHKIDRLEHENESLREEIAALREGIEAKTCSNEQANAFNVADAIRDEREKK